MQRESLSVFGSARVRWLKTRPGTLASIPSLRMLETIKRDIISDFPLEQVDTCFTLVQEQPGLDVPRQRALLLLLLAVMASVRQGSTRVCVRPDARALHQLLHGLIGGHDVSETCALIHDLLNSKSAPTVIGPPDHYRPLIHSGEYVYLQRLHREEARLAQALRARIRSPAPAFETQALESALRDVLARPIAGLVLSLEQQEAVTASLRRRLSITIGGPGTGKTSIILTLLRVLVRLGEAPESIAVAAPTGKAAQRIGDALERGLSSIANPSLHDQQLAALGTAPSTLHRLLGYQPYAQSFAHHERYPLPHSTVIVDECSMVDLCLMSRLAHATSDQARLVLLGDAEQLPSVDAGAVLRDIALPALTTTLRHSHRMNQRDPAGAHLFQVARQIQCGDSQPSLSTRFKVRDLIFSHVELLDTENNPQPHSILLSALLRRWYQEHVVGPTELLASSQRVFEVENGWIGAQDEAGARRLLTHFERHKILCVTRGVERPTGSIRINQAMHALAQQNSDYPEELPALLPGEPVMVEHNDYQRQLFNGDQGIILNTRECGGPVTRMAVFMIGHKLAVFHLSTLSQQITLSYAITVHKSQGSEYSSVLLLLPDQDIPVLSREILYTAVTRSMRSVVLFGSRQLLDLAIRRKLERDSGLAERLSDITNSIDGATQIVGN